MENKTSFKLQWLLFALSMLTIVAYIVIGAITARIDAGTCILLFIMAIPIELFVHAYFTFCIKNNTFTLVAGYDGSIEVNREELKALLATIDFAFCAISTSCIVLTSVLNLLWIGPNWMNGVIVAVYTIDLIAAVLVAGQRSQSKIYIHEIDLLRAQKGMKVAIGYLIALLLIIGGAVAGIILNNAENNSPSALGITFLMLLGIAIITVIFFIANNKIKKWTP